jgi:hypothetical protein
MQLFQYNDEDGSRRLGIWKSFNQLLNTEAGRELQQCISLAFSMGSGSFTGFYHPSLPHGKCATPIWYSSGSPSGRGLSRG